MRMTGIQVLTDTSELVELYKPEGLFLKPWAKVNISVTLPQLKDPGQSISNWDLMERIKKMVNPVQFLSIKVAKSTMEFVRFEAEVPNRETLSKVVKALENGTLKVIGFFEVLRVKASEAKLDFPARHDWDSFFRDSQNMNEMNPGERPDTLYLAGLPVRWFRDSRAEKRDGREDLPSESLLRNVFESFGPVRCVDIPSADRFRTQMSRTGMRLTGFSYGGEVSFEAYVQFAEYISFVKAMDALRGMKLVHLDTDSAPPKALSAPFKVDFDRTKHLSDKNIRRRRLEREQLRDEEKRRLAQEEEERRRIEAEEAKLSQEARERRQKREEKRKIRQLDRKRRREKEDIGQKIKLEERKLLVAERKLKSVRLLTELFRRAEVLKKKEMAETQERDLENAVLQQEAKKARLLQREIKQREELLKKRENMLKQKVLKKYKEQAEKKEELEREEKRKRVHGSRIQSVVRSQSSSHYPEESPPPPDPTESSLDDLVQHYSAAANPRKRDVRRRREGRFSVTVQHNEDNSDSEVLWVD